jgi:hypothetical protein
MNAGEPIAYPPLPGPPPVQSVSLFQAIRGPILLITLGVLFAMDHMDTVAFSRTWPILLIIVGLLKLLERGVQR